MRLVIQASFRGSRVLSLGIVWQLGLIRQGLVRSRSPRSSRLDCGPLDWNFHCLQMYRLPLSSRRPLQWPARVSTSVWVAVLIPLAQVAIKHSLTRSQQVPGRHRKRSCHRTPLRPAVIGSARLHVLRLATARRWVVTGTPSRQQQPVASSESNGKWTRAVRVRTPSNATSSLAGQTWRDALSCPLANTCFAGGSYNTLRGTEAFFGSESDEVWQGPVACFSSKYCRGPITERGHSGDLVLRRESVHGRWVFHLHIGPSRHDGTHIFSNGQLVGQGRTRGTTFWGCEDQ